MKAYICLKTRMDIIQYKVCWKPMRTVILVNIKNSNDLDDNHSLLAHSTQFVICTTTDLKLEPNCIP